MDFGEPIFIYGTPKEAIERIWSFMGEFHHKRIKRKIFLKTILETDSMKFVKKLNEMDYTESRYFPKFGSKTSTIICGDKVILILWEDVVSIIIIQSESTAEAYRKYYEILWEEAIII